jgi:hypothetical protein
MPTWFFSTRNGQWEASNLLNDYNAVQLFEMFTQLPPLARDYFPGSETLDSFGYRYSEERDSFDPNFYHLHGHAGQGWAFRREIIGKHGFYDRCIIGSADHLSAHAMIGNFSSDCFTPDLGNNPIEIECFREWAIPFYEDVRGKISYVPGTILHRWHGTLEDRQHGPRHRRLADCGYDPRTDLRLNEDGCWEWNTDKPELHALLREYFKSRKEDGE